jgi:acyl-CoA synthetase (AMP-forming)/AMP-acid ligase II
MSRSVQWNFAARLVERLGEHSRLIYAPSGELVVGAELASAVAAFAARFDATGLASGDRILIACKLTPLSAIAYLGAMYAGLVPVPVNESVLLATGEYLARKTRVRALWSESDHHRAWSSRAGIAHIESPGQMTGASFPPPVSRREDDLAALMTTSGSTGEPRLVRVSHGNLIANTEAIIRSQRLGSDELAMLILPVSYCFGASVLHTHLYQGGGVVFDSRFMFPDKVLRAIGEYGCTTFAGVPTAYQILLRRSNVGSIPLPTLRRFLQAGGALPAERVKQMREAVPHAEFLVMYGQTEATARISCLPPDRVADKAGSVGLPLDNVSVRIVTPEGGDAAEGESGELWVSGKSVSEGYFDEPEETRRRFREGWLATGDIAWRDREGYLWITGRQGEFVKMRGVRVSFAEIEARVATVADVSECAATVVPHPEAGEAVAIFVVAADHTGDLSAAVRRSLPSEWICDSVSVVAELPRNAHGKLIRSRLTEIAGASRCPALPAPRSAAETAPAKARGGGVKAQRP